MSLSLPCRWLLGTAKKPSPEKPVLLSLLPGFQHLIPMPQPLLLAAHIRPLFLPHLVQQIARNKQIDANRREQAILPSGNGRKT